MAEQKLSLSAAILINVNIMLGAGIFINTALLAQYAGALGFLAYGIVGLLLLPLIISIAALLKIHPSGGFYTFAQKELHPFAGFISSWSYIIGKLASATIMMHVSILLLQQLIPLLAHYNTLALDGIILAIFTGLNVLNMKTGSAIQTMFMVFKALPILFAILVGLFLFDGAYFTGIPPSLIGDGLWRAGRTDFAGVFAALPLVLYATMGFEAACSLSSKIENARKNAPLAIFISYGIVLTLVILYQFAFYSALGSSLAQVEDYREVFPALLTKFLPANRMLTAKPLKLPGWKLLM